ncbi:MAG TPA: hypothetical protein VFB21_19700 [Chthonomonadaceae bacterium]|nr:hypothetical protein [Chthonomonadaceae bacterium]
MAALRSQLPEEAFADAWRVGRTMTPEQAIEYALREEKASDTRRLSQPS